MDISYKSCWTEHGCHTEHCNDDVELAHAYGRHDCCCLEMIQERKRTALCFRRATRTEGLEVEIDSKLSAKMSHGRFEEGQER